MRRMVNRGFLGLSSALALVLALTGCGTTPPPEPTPEPAMAPAHRPARPMPEMRVEQVAGGEAIPPDSAPVSDADMAALRSGERVTLTAQDADVRALLTALAEAAGVNLVVSPEVSGRITVHLENVLAKEALLSVIRESGNMVSEPLRAPWGPVVFYTAPRNIEDMTAEEIERRYGVSADVAEFIVRARVGPVRPEVDAPPARRPPPEPAGPEPRWVFELEGGAAWQSYNDVEIPNDGSATRFSLYDLAGSGPWPAGRVYVTWNINDRHGLRLLVAPFSLTETGTPDRAITFAGSLYAADRATTATYTFNSYRLTYRYRWHQGPTMSAWVGFTAKIRDAVIRLEQGDTVSEKTDLGFVPLLHLAGEWRFAPRWRLGLDVDALAGGPGRAEDVALKLGFDLNRTFSVQAGYRTVEGGADVRDVYTFAWLHYAVVSAAARVGP